MSSDRVTIERLPKGRTVATVRFEEAEYAQAESLALNAFNEQVEIKGFRKGHAPIDQVRARVPQDQLFEETLRVLLKQTLPNLAKEHNIVPVIPPKVEAVSKMPVTLRVTFVERPQVTVKNIDRLAVAKKEAKADPKDVQKVIDSVLNEQRITTEVDRASASGDQVTIDFGATDESGAEIQGMKATGYAVVIGSAQLLPGFEEQLVGLKKGDTKSFTLTLPEKFGVEALRGKKATFAVTVTKIEQVALPELTDAFAKEKLQAESAQAFRALVESSIQAQEEQFQRMSRERELMDEIRKRTSVDIADELLEEEMRTLIQEWGDRLEQQGTTIQQALAKDNKTPEQAEEDFKKQAEERWKLRLGLAKIIEEKQIALTPEELQAAFQRFVGGVPDEQRAEAAKEWENKGELYEELRWRALVEKTIEMLLA